MKKLFLFAVAVILMSNGAKALYYDFTALTPEGVELAYIIMDDGVSVEVCDPGTGSVNVDTLIIPSTVTDGDGNTYTVKAIAKNAFFMCYLKYVEIPETVETIKKDSFYNVSWIEKLVIGKGLKKIESHVFDWGKYSLKVYYRGTVDQWASIIFDDNPLKLYHYLYIEDTLLTNLVFADTTTKVSDNAFSGCWSIESVVFGDNLTDIGNNAFKNCTAIPSLSFGPAVESIGDSAFYGCKGVVKEMEFKGKIPPKFGSNVFQQVSSTMPVKVPCGTYDSYKAALPKTFTNIVEDTIPMLTVGAAVITMGSVEITEEPSCENLSATIEAVPAYGYTFAQWNDGNTTNPRTVSLYQDTVFTAYFDVNTYVVTVLSNNEQYGTVEGSGTYKYLDTVYLKAIPDTSNGCYFDTWDNGWLSNPLTVVVKSDTVITAIFGTKNGIEGAEMDNVEVLVKGRTIVVRNCEGEQVDIMDVNGRVLYTGRMQQGGYAVPSGGLYLVRVNNHRVQRVIVL